MISEIENPKIEFDRIGAMKTKIEIRFDSETKQFKANGTPISDCEARQRWEACDADWSHGAYQEMALRVMT